MNLNLSLISFILLWHSSLFAATITVNNTLDTGAGSLRAAITLANANAGPDVINFNIPGAGVHTISLLTSLPIIWDELYIEGSSQPGYAGQPLIEITGNGMIADILQIAPTAPNTHIRGLVLNNGLTNGILINGANSKVTACYIGTNSAGTAAMSNGVSGIDIRADGVIVGGDMAGEGNLISGNTDYGVYSYSHADNITIQGNLIGTNITGDAAIPNGTGVSTSGDIIYLGGSTLESRNIISGNNLGVNLSGDKSIVRNNYIGTSMTGNVALPNTTYGMICVCDSTLIGGTMPIEANVISGNGTFGLSLSNPRGTRIIGNFVGTDYTGTISVPNNRVGIMSNGATATITIGGTTAAERNIISGNGEGGIRLNSGSQHQILGNYIGTDVTGALPLGNTREGIQANSVQQIIIGGLTAGARNLISANTTAGIAINGADQNYIYGNYIGTDVTGTIAMGNQGIGIALNSSGKNHIGNATAAGANVIAGNGNMGISLNGPDSDSNLVKYNFIGTDPSGFINLANARTGVYVNGGGEDNQIGGTLAGEGNIIAYNMQGGVQVNASASIRNQILGNSIYDHPVNGIRHSSGGNNNQPSPALTGYGGGAGTSTFFGTFNSAPNTSYRLEFFSSPTNNQGKTFLGSVNITTDATGFYAIAETFPITVIASEPVITATATDPDGNTSEFGVATVLDVAITAFSVQEAPDIAARLSWEMPHSYENRFFEIEHKQGQEAFTKLGEQHDFSLNQNHRYYQFDIASLAPGTHFFRLKSLNANGENSYSEILQYEHRLEKAIQIILQNPITGRETLSINLDQPQIIQVALYSLSGQQIDQLFYGDVPAYTHWKIPINGAKYSKGVYLLEVRGIYSRILQKIVIED